MCFPSIVTPKKVEPRIIVSKTVDAEKDGLRDIQNPSESFIKIKGHDSNGVMHETDMIQLLREIKDLTKA